MNDLVSIIIPVHNSEKYLKKCIDSILKQKYTNIEIIFIDNNSTDKSSEIIKKYDDNRIVYIYNNDNNISIARNLGINKSHGKYISFIDSDDEIDSNFILKLIENYKNEIQLSICSYTRNKHYKLINQKYMIDNSKAYELILKRNIAGYIWNKLFLKDIIEKNNLTFDENINVGEDMLFVCNYLLYCQMIVIDYSKLYFYRKHKNQISNKYNQEIISVLNSWLKIKKIYIERNPENVHEIEYRYLKKKIELEKNNHIKINYKIFNIRQKIMLLLYKFFSKEITFIKKGL